VYVVSAMYAAPNTTRPTGSRHHVVCTVIRGLGLRTAQDAAQCACCSGRVAPPRALEPWYKSAPPAHATQASGELGPRTASGAPRHVNAAFVPTDTARQMNGGAGLIPPAEIFRGNTLHAPFALGVRSCSYWNLLAYRSTLQYTSVVS
jgi:hypothetical protein